MAVNLSPVGGVAAQFFDNNGNVLTGGKLYTYAAGTTTPQTTYTNAAGSVAQSNPIILNASGRVPTGEIWLTDGLVYKFALYDANDVLIATYDNITGINSNFVNFTNKQEIQTATAGQTVFTLTTMDYQPGTNSLTVFVDGVNQYGSGAQYAYVETDSSTVTFNAGLHVGAEVKFTTSQLNSTAGNDATLVSYVPPFTGGVGTNVAAKLSETVSVKDFGAVGDGVADDTAAFNATVTGCNGRSIHIPAGTYKITDQVDLSLVLGSGFSVYGDGQSSIVKCVGATAGFYAEYLAGSGVDDHPIGVFEKIHLFGDGTVGQKLFHNAQSFVHIKDVLFYGGYYGYYTNALGYVVQINNCHFKANVNSGAYLKESTSHTFINCYFRGHSKDTGAAAIRFDGTFNEHHQFIGGAIEGNTGEAVAIEAGGNTESAIEVSFKDIYFELDGFNNDGVSSIRNSSPNATALNFDSCKFSYNIVGSWISGPYDLGQRAFITNSTIGGVIKCNYLILMNNAIEDATFIGSTNNEPCTLVSSINNTWQDGFLGSGGYVFNVMPNVADVVDMDMDNIIAAPFTYPMGVGVTTATIASGTGADFGFGNVAEITYAASPGSPSTNILDFGNLTGSGIARVWSMLIASNSTAGFAVIATGSGQVATLQCSLVANKRYRLLVIGRRNIIGSVSLRVYPTDSTGATVYVTGTYASSFSTANFMEASNKINRLASGNIPM